jgi:hypothetical protein
MVAAHASTSPLFSLPPSLTMCMWWVRGSATAILSNKTVRIFVNAVKDSLFKNRGLIFCRFVGLFFYEGVFFNNGKSGFSFFVCFLV